MVVIMLHEILCRMFKLTHKQLCVETSALFNGPYFPLKIPAQIQSSSKTSRGKAKQETSKYIVL